jgi:uncharacterized protein (UPF0335 family)
MAVTKEIVLEVGLKDSTGQGAESAKKRLREMQRALVDLAVAGKESTEEFRKLEAEAGELSDTIGDVSQRVKNMGSDTKNIEAFTQAVQGVAAGFQIAQGAVAGQCDHGYCQWNHASKHLAAKGIGYLNDGQ